MVKIVVIVLALLGICCYLFDILWLNIEIQSLLKQTENLIELGLLEEADYYKEEVESLSFWVIPIAILGFALETPLIIYILKFRFINSNSID